jgi:hypothetical protein
VSDIEEVERAADGSDDTAHYSAWRGADAISRQRSGYASGYESGSHTLFDILAEMFDAVKETAPAESAADYLGLVEREFAQCGSIVGRAPIHILHHRSP